MDGLFAFGLGLLGEWGHGENLFQGILEFDTVQS
jgi:hypothetical protein